MSRDISEDDTDYSEEESFIINRKKGMIINDSSDEEYTSPDRNQASSGIFSSTTRENEATFSRREADSDIISETDEDNSDVSSSMKNISEDMTTLLSPIKKEMDSSRNEKTPQQGQDYNKAYRSGTVVISSDSEDGNQLSVRRRGRPSFMTPQNKKQETFDSDSDDSFEESLQISSDMVDTSQILDDSFEAETPKAATKKKSVSATPKIQIQKSNIISSESDDVDTPVKQMDQTRKNEKVQIKLDDLLKKMSTNNEDSIIKCKRTEYNKQIGEINSYEQQMMKVKKLMSTIKLSNLPDKGQLLKERFESYKEKFLKAQNQLKKMKVVEEDAPEEATSENKNSMGGWNNIEASIATVQPKTFGKKGLENHNLQKALTAERLELLHGSLKNCPKDDDLAEQPEGIKVTLMDHQRRALAWMVYRETQKPAGGILADDMGLGKTLTMISLVLRKNLHNTESDEEDRESPTKRHRKYNGGTLVVCPASLLNQWAQEIDTKLKRGMLSHNVYHGPKRETKPKKLAEHDVVITTYSIVMNEHEREGALFRVRWKRIILDEAHQIRNHKAQTSIACCALAGVYRWALTGTPVHNKELDMYALLKFLRCSPFDDLAVWKRWVGDKSSGGGERLNTVISSLMLRRTKIELMAQGKLNNLPSQKWDLIPINLDESEMSLYQKILLFSQTLFAQFLHQKAEKNQDIINFRSPNVKADPNNEYFKMRKKLLRLNQMKEVNQHDILVLLLRLRQICCHPSLIVNMLQGDEDLGDEEPEEREEINLLEQLNKLNLEDDQHNPAEGISAEVVGFKEATKGILNPSHPLFAKDRISSKIKEAMKLIPNILSSGDKIIIVSQWTSFLELFGWQLKDSGIKFTKLDGSVPTAKRTEMVTDFNDPNSRIKVLLLSLTAGGVGLNLVGANHLFLLDLHWNPQLEKQAQDRIYRMGQKKNVNIYKFMASETIEERIKHLQEDKLALAENMMTGSKQVVGNKLSLQDLKMLFNM